MVQTRRRGLAMLTVAVIGLSLVPQRSEARLVFVGEAHDGVDGVDGLQGARGVALSPDGRNLYAVGVTGDSLAVFSRNGAAGVLTFLEVHRQGVAGVDGLDGPLQVAVSPDGLSVYAVSGTDDAVAVFQRDPGTGRLVYFTAYLGVGAGQGAPNGVRSIAISPDGLVYIGTDGPVLIAFTRDAASGALTLSEVETNGSGGVSGMSALASLAVTPDGGRLYGIGFRTFVTFARTPALAFLSQTTPAVSNFFSTGAVAISSNGVDVYATADVHNGPTHSLGALGFLRESATPGQLTIVQQLEVGSGVTEPRAIAATADGKFVVVGSLGDVEVAAFRRASDGTLEQSQNLDTRLRDVFSLVVSADSQFLYVAGANSDNVVVFRILPDPDPLEIPTVSPTGAAVLLILFGIALVTRSSRALRRTIRG